MVHICVFTLTFLNNLFMKVFCGSFSETFPYLFFTSPVSLSLPFFVPSLSPISGIFLGMERTQGVGGERERERERERTRMK